MPHRRPPAGRTDAAARRLAQLAAGLGSAPAGLPDPADDTDEAWWSDHTRVAATAPVAPPLVEERLVDERDATPLLPLPGRHASRRRRAGVLDGWRERVPVLAPVHVALVALAVALGLAVTTWWVVRDDPGAPVAPVSAEPVSPLVEPSLPPSPSSAGAPSGMPSEAPSAGATVTVDVAGKVRHPGIVVLDQGARVTDAIEAAGGAKRGVDLTSLNLARVLVDGEQVVVGAGGAAAAPAGSTPGSEAGVAPGAAPVNLNLASQAELETLPQVGPVTAQAIIAWRDQQGGFTSVDQLLEVDGIGEKTLARLGPYVTV